MAQNRIHSHAWNHWRNRVAPRFALACLLFAVGGACHDGWADARDELGLRLDGLEHLAADFTQRLEDARGQLIEESSGRVRLQPPNFRWEVTEPHAQVLVVTADELKVYDPDLEQMTVRPLADALEDTPLALLTQDGVILDENQDVIRLDGNRFRVRPQAPNALFDELILTFGDGGELAGLSIRDHLGQRTLIRFQRFQEAAVIQPDDFQLEVPPGTDVY